VLTLDSSQKDYHDQANFKDQTDGKDFENISITVLKSINSFRYLKIRFSLSIKINNSMIDRIGNDD
jgi:hypothetical protein